MFNGYGLFALSLTSTLTASANYFANPMSVLQSVTWVQYQRLSDICFLFMIQKSKALGDLLQQIAESGRNLRDKSRHTSSPTSQCSDSQSSPPQVLQLSNPHGSGLTVPSLAKTANMRGGRRMRDKGRRAGMNQGWPETLCSSFTMQNQH